MQNEKCSNKTLRVCGAGGVRKNKGKWQAVVTVADEMTGKKVQRTRNTRVPCLKQSARGKAAAMRVLAEFRSEVELELASAERARAAVRVLIRLMMAHHDPKALQHIVEPEIELRLDALAERIAQGELRHLRHTAVQPLNLCHRAHGPSPFRHGIVSSTRPLPIRTNITRQGKPLKAVRHNMRPNPPPAGQANNEGAHGTGAALQPSRQACHLAKS